MKHASRPPAMPVMPTLVTFAVPEEARPFLDRARTHPNIEVLLTGIGPDRARQTLQAHLAHSSPALIISSGFAGGLHPDLAAGDIVCDPSRAPWLQPTLRSLHARSLRFQSAPNVLVTPGEKAQFRQAFGADVVDMESDAICRVAANHGIPCAVVRVISDAADDALPVDFNRFLAPDGRLRIARLAGQCLRHPSTLRGLLQLQRTTRSAARTLAATLAALIDQAPPPPQTPIAREPPSDPPSGPRSG